MNKPTYLKPTPEQLEAFKQKIEAAADAFVDLSKLTPCRCGAEHDADAALDRAMARDGVRK